MKSSPDFPFLVYDDSCSLCCRFKMALERIPGTSKLDFVPLSSETLFEDHPYLNKQDCTKEVHLVESPEKIHVGAQALEFLVESIPACRPFLWLIESERGQKSLDYFYRKTNELRERVRRDCPGCL